MAVRAEQISASSRTVPGRTVNVMAMSAAMLHKSAQNERKNKNSQKVQ